MKMPKNSSMVLITFFTSLLLIAGCGDDDDADDGGEPPEWGEWENVLEDGELPGKLVEGKTWEHYPEFGAEVERQFRYWDISTNQPVDAYVADAEDCQSGASIDSWSDIEELIVGEEELIVDEEVAELPDDNGFSAPICVGFHAHLIGDGGSWYIGVEMRQRPRSE